MVIVVIAYHHIYVDASNHYAPEPSVVFPTVCKFYFASLYSVFRKPHICFSQPVVVETYKIRVNALEVINQTLLVTPPGVDPGFPP